MNFFRLIEDELAHFSAETVGQRQAQALAAVGLKPSVLGP